MLIPKLLKDANQALGRDRGVDLDMQYFTVEVIRDIERAESLASASDMKSADHTVSGSAGTYSSARCRFGSRFLARRRKCRSISL
jgi:hypothetical protein